MKNSLNDNSLNIVEIGGRGGVYQHSLAVALVLQEEGVHVNLLTASDMEISDDRVNVVECFTWLRSAKRLRSLRIALSFMTRTIPKVALTTGDVWVQGTFKPALTFLMIRVLRLAGRSVIFSPHNLFVREGGKVDRVFLNLSIKAASSVVVYNRNDIETLRRLGINAMLGPLLQYIPEIREETENKWREKIAKLGVLVCSIGQIRTDKNLPMLVRASRLAQAPLLVIGADVGGGAEVLRARDEGDAGGCSVFEGYYPLEDLAAVVAIVGTVALPYSVASSSGVAVLAKAYGATVIARSVGGLSGQADVLVDGLGTEDWAEALFLNVVPKWNLPIKVPLGPTNEERIALVKIITGNPVVDR
jgi:glycosyltransferase involved in cell wall biosynthesis